MARRGKIGQEKGEEFCAQTITNETDPQRTLEGNFVVLRENKERQPLCSGTG